MKTNNVVSNIFTVNYEDFQAKVLDFSQHTPVLVDLWADWCPPCVVISPILSDIILQLNGKLALAKVEVDEGDNMKLAGQYQVRGFPTILLIHKGEVLDRFSGAKSTSFVNNFINTHLQLS